MQKRKKRLGDRKDGYLLRDLDSMHFIVPQLYPNRCDNEAYISERIPLDPINEWLEKHNTEENVYPFTMFHVIVAAFLKTITLRPKMNRFIVNKNIYMRNEISASFVVKKLFSDDGAEALAFVHAEENDNIFTVHQKIFEQISACRSDKADSSTDSMDMFNKMPRFLAKTIVSFICFLDKHGKVPQPLIDTDPYYSTVVLSNLGSIKLKSGYHHLTNWGTNSIFCIIGERKKTPVFNDDGSFEKQETVDIGLTIDERLADGYYYSKTVRLLKHLLAHPELLENNFIEEVDY